MKAAVLEDIKKIRVRDIDKPSVSSNNALIKVKACGICGTDVHAYNGDWIPKLPVVLGHEFAGIVEEIGPEVKYSKVGDRVTISPDIYCHNCDYCRTGNERLCRNVECLGQEWDGAFAEYCLVPEQLVYKIPDNVSFEAASFIEPMACASTVVKNIDNIYNKRILVTGAGSVGLIFVMLLKNSLPLKLDITSRSDIKLEVAKKIGADEVFNTNDFRGSLTGLTDNRYDVIIDVSGVSKVVENSFDLLDRNGSLYLFGVPSSDCILQLNHLDIFNKDLRIFGAIPDLRSFDPLIKMLEKKILDPGIIISHRFSLDDFIEGFDLVTKGDSAMKIIIKP